MKTGCSYAHEIWITPERKIIPSVCKGCGIKCPEDKWHRNRLWHCNKSALEGRWTRGNQICLCDLQNKVLTMYNNKGIICGMLIFFLLVTPWMLCSFCRGVSQCTLLTVMPVFNHHSPTVTAAPNPPISDTVSSIKSSNPVPISISCSNIWQSGLQLWATLAEKFPLS